MAIDEGENTQRFEPLMISAGSKERGKLSDLALELAEKSAALRSGLPPSIATALADLVRAMNCYYSNLIEGHNTHPIDIERALQGDYSDDPKKRDLQLEAKAHIEVQQWIDNDGMTEPPTSPASIIEMHRRFCELLPKDLLFVEDPLTRKNIIQRDNYICQYCGKYSKDITIDHIVPKVKKGKDSWENLVSACVKCNLKKGNKLISQTNMKLLRKPCKPSYIYQLQKYVNKTNKSWKPYLFMDKN